MGLNDLSEVLLLHVLDLSPDASVLELAATSCGLRSGVEACREIRQEGGPWRHHKGLWEVSGLWRFLGLGDLKTMPHVTFCCETKFQHVKELLAFYKAAQAFAADTIDGRVTFHKFTFKGSAKLFCGQQVDFMAPSDQIADVDFNGRQIECSLDAHLHPEDEAPWINLFVNNEDDNRPDAPQNLLMCCSSPVLPDLRLLAGFEASTIIIYNDHQLDSESPLTELMHANTPLPMMFGVKGLDGEGFDD